MLLGLSSLVSLLDSEYPVVQELALLTLTHCSQDGESRECLRDIGALQKIVEFLQNKVGVLSYTVFISSRLYDEDVCV